jgi:hypothetical protein|tara:strand:+ start:750 stop:1412 length:663 start_codon:yes stop_codon:yes gene_type:complete
VGEGPEKRKRSTSKSRIATSQNLSPRAEPTNECGNNQKKESGSIEVNVLIRLNHLVQQERILSTLPQNCETDNHESIEFQSEVISTAPLGCTDSKFDDTQKKETQIRSGIIAVGDESPVVSSTRRSNCSAILTRNNKNEIVGEALKYADSSANKGKSNHHIGLTKDLTNLIKGNTNYLHDEEHCSGIDGSHVNDALYNEEPFKNANHFDHAKSIGCSDTF